MSKVCLSHSWFLKAGRNVLLCTLMPTSSALKLARMFKVYVDKALLSRTWTLDREAINSSAKVKEVVSTADVKGFFLELVMKHSFLRPLRLESLIVPTWMNTGVLLCLPRDLTGVASHLSQFFPVGPVHAPELFLRGLPSRTGLPLHTQRAEDLCLHRLEEFRPLGVHDRRAPGARVGSSLPGPGQEDQQHAGSELIGEEWTEHGEPAW